MLASAAATGAAASGRSPAWSPESSTSGPAGRSSGRAGPLRVFEPSRRERLVAGREAAAEHAGHEARDRLDDHRRRDLAAREHEVADAQLLVDQRRSRARRCPRSGRRPASDAARPPARAPAPDRTARPAASAGCGARGRAPPRSRRARRQSARRADHPRAAAVGRVVDLAVAPRREVARVRAVHGQQAAPRWRGRAAWPRGTRQDLGEQRDELERQRRRVSVGARVVPVIVSSQRTRILRPGVDAQDEVRNQGDKRPSLPRPLAPLGSPP